MLDVTASSTCKHKVNSRHFIFDFTHNVGVVLKIISSWDSLEYTWAVREAGVSEGGKDCWHLVLIQFWPPLRSRAGADTSLHDNDQFVQSSHEARTLHRSRTCTFIFHFATSHQSDLKHDYSVPQNNTKTPQFNGLTNPLQTHNRPLNHCSTALPISPLPCLNIGSILKHTWHVIGQCCGYKGRMRERELTY